MRGVTTEDDLADLCLAWKRVFRSSDAWDWVFAARIERALVFYPTGVNELSEHHFRAVQETAMEAGESFAYVSTITRPGPAEPFPGYAHWLLHWSDSYWSYSDDLIPLENCIYSPTGGWGISVSSECFAVFGGSTEVIERLRSHVPDWRTQEASFRAWADSLEPRMAERILPPEKTRDD
jgi:hypothetical protein